jgi:hypothetical protein
MPTRGHVQEDRGDARDPGAVLLVVAMSASDAERDRKDLDNPSRMAHQDLEHHDLNIQLVVSATKKTSAPDRTPKLAPVAERCINVCMPGARAKLMCVRPPRRAKVVQISDHAPPAREHSGFLGRRLASSTWCSSAAKKQPRAGWTDPGHARTSLLLQVPLEDLRLAFDDLGFVLLHSSGNAFRGLSPSLRTTVLRQHAPPGRAQPNNLGTFTISIGRRRYCTRHL